MLFPLFNLFKLKIHQMPWTLFLILLNSFVYLVELEPNTAQSERLENALNEPDFLETQGHLYSEHLLLRNHSKETSLSPWLLGLAKESSVNTESARLMGELALRDQSFLEKGSTDEFFGDQDQIKTWRKNFREFQSIQTDHPSFQWGFRSGNFAWIQLITYQFSHSGFSHLFWNMLFLLFVGSFVEVTWGPSLLVFSYLGGSLLGALSFSLLSSSAVPLVGASASVAALIGLVCFRMWREKIQYFYWFLPWPGYFGTRSFPAYFLIFLFIIPDLAGVLSSPADFGSISHAAHLGGFAWGLALSVLLKHGVLTPDHGKTQAPQD